MILIQCDYLVSSVVHLLNHLGIFIIFDGVSDPKLSGCILSEKF